ncbi:MAG: hypothetical protein IPP40_16950 [bacterium]|nr:hypothetical protein [bacterium]
MVSTHLMFRNNVPLTRLTTIMPGFNEQFFDNSPCRDCRVCTKRSWALGRSCEGPEACDNGAAGAGPNCTITNVDASDDDCDEVVLLDFNLSRCGFI